MTKNIKTVIWAGVAIVMLIVGATVYIYQKPKHLARPKNWPIKVVATDKANNAVMSNTGLTTSSTTTATATLVSKSIHKTKSALPRLSYGEAVVKYNNSRIQFGQDCTEAIPNRLAIANPVTLMLDNRSDSKQTITLAGKSYIIEAYDYTLASLNIKMLPQDLFVNCNRQTNVAEIILQ